MARCGHMLYGIELIQRKLLARIRICFCIKKYDLSYLWLELIDNIEKSTDNLILWVMQVQALWNIHILTEAMSRTRALSDMGDFLQKWIE